MPNSKQDQDLSSFVTNAEEDTAYSSLEALNDEQDEEMEALFAELEAMGEESDEELT